MRRVISIYAAVSAIFVVGMCLVLYAGQNYFPSAVALGSGSHSSTWSVLLENFNEPLTRLLVQFIVILVATRLAGMLVRLIGQPAVVGEILAGILLGPSLLGWVAPAFSGFVFFKPSLLTLQLFSQIGVCLFMFVIGLKLDVDHLRGRTQTALVVSHSSIMIPFLFGAGSAILLYPAYSTGKTTFLSFALFIGIAMSITAFPVLARILSDRGLTRTPLGATAITCASVGDATAWAILAFVVAIARATGPIPILINLGLLAVYIAAMLFAVRPFLLRVVTVDRLRGRPFIIAAILAIMTGSALFTQAIGIHALFGAFLAGVVMPRNKDFLDYLSVRLESFGTVFLLPLFFAFSGLRTQVNLLNDASSWLVMLGIVALAVTGKLVGSMIPARLTGTSWSESFQLGALMNCRGLVELIALNLGYDLGILSPRIFAMLVLMALITTFMTSPLLSLVAWAERRAVRPALDPAFAQDR